MELVVRKNDLLKELSLLQGIVERKNTIPILANVDATKDGICFAPDLDVGLRSRCEELSANPVLTLPAKLSRSSARFRRPKFASTRRRAAERHHRCRSIRVQNSTLPAAVSDTAY
jgi:hypothetical protein